MQDELLSFFNFFDLNISAPLILKIAVFVIAGVILISELPEFFMRLYGYLETKGGAYPFTSMLVVSFIKIVIALLMVGERKRIIDTIMERRSITLEENETNDEHNL